MPIQLMEFIERSDSAAVGAIFDHAPIMLVVAGRDGRIERVSRFLAKSIGYEVEELIGRDQLELITAPSQIRVQESILPRFLQEGRIGNAALNLVRKDGSILPVRLSSVTIAEDGKDAGRSFSILFDDSNAHASNHLLDLALEAIPEGFVIYDAEDRLVRCNDAYRRIYAASAPAMIEGASFRSILQYGLDHGQYPAAGKTPESRQAWLDERLRLRRTTQTDLEQQVGPDTWLAITEKRTESGHVVGIRKDISALKLAQREAARYGDILENSSHEIFVTNLTEHRFVTVNRAARRNLQYTLEELQQMGPVDISAALVPGTALEEKIRGFVESDETHLRITTEHRRKDGTIYPCDIRLEIDRSGKDPMAIAFCEDISERVELLSRIDARTAELERKNQELMLAVAEAERASRAKSVFLANMSHEIRTPLNGVLGMTAALNQTTLTPEQKTMTKAVLSSGKQLSTLLNDVLDLAKIESGEISLEVETVNPQDILTDVAALFDARAEEKDLSVDVSISRRARGSIVANASRIRQVVTNLVSNAIKFTRTGGIVLAADLRGTGDGETAMFEVSVTDSGPGVPDTLKEAIFGRFEQGEHTAEQALGGTGLGLSIARTICELHDGSLRVEDAPTGGARFIASFAVRLAVEEEPEPEAPDAATRLRRLSRPLRLLVAEDNTTNQQVLQVLLSMAANVEPVFVWNGQEALELLERETFDAALVDIRMPVMNGLEMIRAVRAQEERTGAPRMPMIACSANVMSDQIAHYIETGFDTHLAKPIGLDALAECLEWTCRAVDSRLGPRSRRARSA